MRFNKEQMAYLEENMGKTILPFSNFENKIRLGTEPIEVLLYYKKDWTAQQYFEAFVKAANHYNLFSSRIIRIDDDKYALHYCTDGVQLHILPPIDETFDKINVEDIKKKIAKVKTLPGEPLLSLTVIKLKDGSLGGVSCSHAVCDGIIFILFLSLWGCFIEGTEPPQPSPQRLFKGKPISSDKIDKIFLPPLSELSDEIKERLKSADEKIYTKREYFPDELLEENKKKAKLENEKYNISNNQIINALILKNYHKQMLPNAGRIRLRTPINLRDVHPDIDSLYLGNAYFDSIAEFATDEMDKLSIYEIAYRLKESIAVMRDVEYIKGIASLSKYGIQLNSDLIENYSLYNIDTDMISANLAHLNDIATLGLGEDKGKFLYVTTPVHTGFVVLKETSGEIFADITSRFPFK